MIDPAPNRLEKLPRREREVWQGGLVRVPLWVTPPGTEPFRPWSGAWMSLQSGKAHVGAPRTPAQKSPAQALDALAEFAFDKEIAGYLPGSVEVSDTQVREVLERALRPLGIRVVERVRLHGLEGVLDALAESGNARVIPSPLEPRGVTVERLASFAEAARLFHKAAPWKRLGNEDLIRIEEPRDTGSMRHLLVMGAAGRERGVMFFESASVLDAILQGADAQGRLDKEVRCSVFFGDITELPLADADFFEDHRPSVAGPKAYPWAALIGPGRRVRRPGPQALGRIEAILRALAVTTQREVGSGRWTRLVPSPDGAVKVTLARGGDEQGDAS